jgi:serine/threonine protein kinase
MISYHIIYIDHVSSPYHHISSSNYRIIMNQVPEEIDATSSQDNIALQEKYRNRTLINQRYIFEKKIGAGSFGTVYRGKNIISGDGVAIKFEATTAKLPTLLWESKILNHLAGTAGVVKLRYFGVESNKNIIVMDLFSHSLSEEIQKMKTGISSCITKTEKKSTETETESQEEIVSETDIGKKGTNSSSEQDNLDGGDVSQDCSSSAGGEGEKVNDDIDSMIKKLPPFTKEVVGYMIEMLQIISRVHDAGIVHRDIKPENFMIGISKSDKEQKENEGKMLHLIDFGLSKFYKKGDKHVINTNDKSMVGTMRYVSTYIHDGSVYSRRDDIISILYVSIYLLKGTLPWCGLCSKKGDTQTKEQMVYAKKVNTTSAEVCEGLPALFKKLVEYAYSLEFEEKPDYLYMIRQCKVLMRAL